MKAINISSVFSLLFISILLVSCSGHCDDEDYKQERQKKKIVQNDSLAIRNLE